MSYDLDQDVLLGGELNIERIQQFFAEAVATRKWQRANEVFKALVAGHPAHVQLCSLYIALLLKQGDQASAMHYIEKMVAHPACDDALIDAAVAVRKQTVAQKKASGVEPDISLCMIVRNEARYLGRCLYHHASLVDEIIVVDTGSDDRTKDIAFIYNARIFDFPWQNDFAVARNFSLSKATGRWILVLDADELIASKDLPYLRKVAGGPEATASAYSMTTRNYDHKANVVGWQPNSGSYKPYERGLGWFPSTKVRLFKRDSAVFFDFPVHERVEPSLKARGVRIGSCPVPVHHYGHLDQALNEKKARAYYALGQAKLDRFKNNPEGLRELAVQAGQLEQWREAIDLWRLLLTLKPTYAEGFVNLAGAHWQLGQYQPALSFSRKALDFAPRLKEARFNAAISYLMLRQLGPARTILNDLLASTPDYVAARFMLTGVLAAAGDPDSAAQEVNRLVQTIGAPVVRVALEDLSRRFERDGSTDYARSVDRVKTRITGKMPEGLENR